MVQNLVFFKETLKVINVIQQNLWKCPLKYFECVSYTLTTISNMARNGRYGGPLRPPRVILVGAKGSQWPTPVVGYDVQPCSTNVQPL